MQTFSEVSKILLGLYADNIPRIALSQSGSVLIARQLAEEEPHLLLDGEAYIRLQAIEEGWDVIVRKDLG